MAPQVEGKTPLAFRLTANLTEDVQLSRSETKKAMLTAANLQKSSKTVALSTIAVSALIAKKVYDLTKAYATQERAEQKLRVALNRTSGMADETFKTYQQTALDISRATTFTDEAILETAAVFEAAGGLGRETIEKGIDSALDLAAFLETDAAGVAKQLAKALKNPKAGLDALQRINVTITEGQKRYIESQVDANNLVGAQQAILAQIQYQFDGQKEAAAAGTGSLKQLSNEMKNIVQAIDRQMLPEAVAVAKIITANLLDLKESPEVFLALKGLVIAFFRVSASLFDGVVTQAVAYLNAVHDVLRPIQLRNQFDLINFKPLRAIQNLYRNKDILIGPLVNLKNLVLSLDDIADQAMDDVLVESIEFQKKQAEAMAAQNKLSAQRGKKEKISLLSKQLSAYAKMIEAMSEKKRAMIFRGGELERLTALQTSIDLLQKEEDLRVLELEASFAETQQQLVLDANQRTQELDAISALRAEDFKTKLTNDKILERLEIQRNTDINNVRADLRRQRLSLQQGYLLKRTNEQQIQDEKFKVHYGDIGNFIVGIEQLSNDVRFDIFISVYELFTQIAKSSVGKHMKWLKYIHILIMIIQSTFDKAAIFGREEENNPYFGWVIALIICFLIDVALALAIYNIIREPTNPQGLAVGSSGSPQAGSRPTGDTKSSLNVGAYKLGEVNLPSNARLIIEDSQARVADDLIEDDEVDMVDVSLTIPKALEGVLIIQEGFA